MRYLAKKSALYLLFFFHSFFSLSHKYPLHLDTQKYSHSSHALATTSALHNFPYIYINPHILPSPPFPQASRHTFTASSSRVRASYLQVCSRVLSYPSNTSEASSLTPENKSTAYIHQRPSIRSTHKQSFQPWVSPRTTQVTVLRELHALKPRSLLPSNHFYTIISRRPSTPGILGQKNSSRTPTSSKCQLQYGRLSVVRTK